MDGNLLMNKKAFTLIELLAVIVILAIIALISTPIVLSIIENANNSTTKISLDSIERAAYLYNVENDKSIEFKLKDGNLVSDTGEVLELDGELGEDSGVRITSSGNIYAYMYKNGYCILKRGNDNKVEQFKTDKELCNMDVATNLVVNGYGEYKDNTNFSKFTYEGGSFKIESSQNDFLYTDEFVEINPNNKYYEEVSIKSNNTEAVYYSGILEYDIDKNIIHAQHVLYIPNTLTYLTKDLKNGDTTVYLDNITNFVTVNKGTTSGLIFWNYKDSTGYEYPELTYSRNIWLGLYEESGINKSNNTITLNSPWNNGLIKSGTKVSQTFNSGYNYGLYVNKKMTSEYQMFSNVIQGVYDNGKEKYSKFRPGTKYIKFFTMDNYNNKSDVVTHYKNIVIREID